MLIRYADRMYLVCQILVKIWLAIEWAKSKKYSTKKNKLTHLFIRQSVFLNRSRWCTFVWNAFVHWRWCSFTLHFSLGAFLTQNQKIHAIQFLDYPIVLWITARLERHGIKKQEFSGSVSKTHRTRKTRQTNSTSCEQKQLKQMDTISSCSHTT